MHSCSIGFCMTSVILNAQYSLTWVKQYMSEAVLVPVLRRVWARRSAQPVFCDQVFIVCREMIE
uniref:Uncharacterized protein n=1 Tax=Anguilla anguilla TaxID=7936 RepID=A0A0E9R122_ANGAN